MRTRSSVRTLGKGRGHRPAVAPQSGKASVVRESERVRTRDRRGQLVALVDGRSAVGVGDAGNQAEVEDRHGDQGLDHVPISELIVENIQTDLKVRLERTLVEVEREALVPPWQSAHEAPAGNLGLHRGEREHLNTRGNGSANAPYQDRGDEAFGMFEARRLDPERVREVVCSRSLGWDNRPTPNVEVSHAEWRAPTACMSTGRDLTMLVTGQLPGPTPHPPFREFERVLLRAVHELRLPTDCPGRNLPRGTTSSICLERVGADHGTCGICPCDFEAQVGSPWTTINRVRLSVIPKAKPPFDRLH